jgi:hypothetical protein
MGSDETGSTGKPVDSTVALIREAVTQQLSVADEWSRIAPDDITSMGFAKISKAVCSLLRTNAKLLENVSRLIESNPHERRNPKCDYQAGDSANDP